MSLKTIDMFNERDLKLKKMNNLINIGSLDKHRKSIPVFNKRQKKILVGNKSNLVSK